jgi:hypothetical protein
MVESGEEGSSKTKIWNIRTLMTVHDFICVQLRIIIRKFTKKNILQTVYSKDIRLNFPSANFIILLLAAEKQNQVSGKFCQAARAVEERHGKDRGLQCVYILILPRVD